jgi:hypothetical protein
VAKNCKTNPIIFVITPKMALIQKTKPNQSQFPLWPFAESLPHNDADWWQKYKTKPNWTTETMKYETNPKLSPAKSASGGQTQIRF